MLMTRLVTASSAVLTTATLASVVAVAVRPGPQVASVPATPAPSAQSRATRTDQSQPADRVVREAKEEPRKRGALRVARLKHAGDWNLAPRAVPNLMDSLRKPPFDFNVMLTQKDLFLRDPALIYYPLIYLHGRGALSFPREDFEALRRHLDPGGGTLFADAHCADPAFDASFHRFVAELLPGHKLEPIPRDDELYHLTGGFDLRDCRYTKAAGGDKDFPQLEGGQDQRALGDHLLEARPGLRAGPAPGDRM
jgi:hypothetical protein